MEMENGRAAPAGAERKKVYEVEVFEGRRDPRDLNKNGDFAGFWPYDSRGFLILLSLRARVALSPLPGLADLITRRGTPMNRSVRYDGRGGGLMGWIMGWMMPRDRKMPTAANLISHASLSSAILDHIRVTYGEKGGRFDANFNARVKTGPLPPAPCVTTSSLAATVHALLFEDAYWKSNQPMERHWYAFTLPKLNMPEGARDEGTMSIWMGDTGRHRKTQSTLCHAGNTNPCTMTDSGALESASALKHFLKEEFPDFDGRVPDSELEHIVKQNPGKALKVRCNYYHDVEAKTLIMGDAAHAVFPSAGQGANGAMLDVKAFNEVLDEVGDDLDKALPMFSQRQVPEGRAMWHLSPSELFPGNVLRTCRLLLIRRLRGILSPYFPSLIWPEERMMLAATLTPYAKIVEVYGPMDW
eukprot:jgi/Chlat1/2787/Chrsp187S02952